MAFTRINGRTTTMSAQTATAAATLSLRVRLCFSSQHLITRRPRRVPSTMSTSPSSSTLTRLVSSVKTFSQRYPPEDRPERRVPATDRKSDSACIVLHHLGSTQSECGFTTSVWCFVPFRLTPHHKTYKTQPANSRRCWVSTTTNTWPQASSRTSPTIRRT